MNSYAIRFTSGEIEIEVKYLVLDSTAGHSVALGLEAKYHSWNWLYRLHAVMIRFIFLSVFWGQLWTDINILQPGDNLSLYLQDQRAVWERCMLI